LPNLLTNGNRHHVKFDLAKCKRLDECSSTFLRKRLRAFVREDSENTLIIRRPLSIPPSLRLVDLRAKVVNQEERYFLEMEETATCESNSEGKKPYRYYVCGTAMQRGWSECPAPSVPAGEIERFVVEQIRTIGKDPALLKQTTIDVQQRTQVESKQLKDEQNSLSRQMRDDQAKLQAIAAKPNIASN
jgi:Recombinase zinc beta ribbon domain